MKLALQRLAAISRSKMVPREAVLPRCACLFHQAKGSDSIQKNNTAVAACLPDFTPHIGLEWTRYLPWELSKSNTASSAITEVPNV